MDKPSTPCKHKFVKDEGDKRFKVCTLCGMPAYRSDKELMEEAKK